MGEETLQLLSSWNMVPRSCHIVLQLDRIASLLSASIPIRSLLRQTAIIGGHGHRPIPDIPSHNHALCSTLCAPRTLPRPLITFRMIMCVGAFDRLRRLPRHSATKCGWSVRRPSVITYSDLLY